MRHTHYFVKKLFISIKFIKFYRNKPQKQSNLLKNMRDTHISMRHTHFFKIRQVNIKNIYSIYEHEKNEILDSRSHIKKLINQYFQEFEQYRVISSGWSG